MLLLIVGICPAQVQSAADAGAGVYTSILAQGSLVVINYTQITASLLAPANSATVSLLPANATAPVSAQVVSVTPNAIVFVVPAGTPAGDAQLIYKPGSQATQWLRVSIVPANFALFRSGLTGPLRAQNIKSGRHSGVERSRNAGAAWAASRSLGYGTRFDAPGRC